MERARELRGWAVVIGRHSYILIPIADGFAHKNQDFGNGRTLLRAGLTR